MKLATFKPTTGMHPFTITHLNGLLEIRIDTEGLCFWPCPHANSEILFDGLVKCDGGVRHLVHRYTRVSVHGVVLDTLCYGVFSRRPHQLAQPCVGSITDCRLALFIRCCRDPEGCSDRGDRSAYRRQALHALSPCGRPMKLALFSWAAVLPLTHGQGQAGYGPR